MNMIRSSIIWRTGLGLLMLSAGLFTTVLSTHAAPVTHRDPVLRVETGAHLTTINRISADKEGRWIVTASEDTTVRLWDGRTGQALSVLRPPLGNDNVGAIYAAVISPDGRSVALGGNAKFGDSSGYVMHLFDRASASVPPKSTLTGLEAPVTQLAWSPDSKLLAIGLLQEGLRVFSRDLQFVGSDPQFNEPIYGADFTGNDRLAVASMDGAIRLYRIDRGAMERIARVTAPGGKPYGVAFSPDGQTLAVGYQDNARVDLLDTRNLKLIRRIDMGRNMGNLGRVVWSTDGETLFAAGGYVSNARFPVLGFGNKGTAAAIEVGSFSNNITSLAALPGGQIAASSAEPGWTVLTSNGQRTMGSQPQGPDFRDSDLHFRLNADASVVSFQFKFGAENQVFNLFGGNLKTIQAPDSATPPLQNGAPYVENWKNSTSPQVNGRALSLKPRESSRSLAINAADHSFVLGSDWTVRRFAQNGSQLWEQRISAPAWAINLSLDGRWVVAGLGDGSVRWFRASDGVEQLAFFAHTDKSRWIVWTPTGYYDTSIDGEDLVGWHLNRAFNQSADYFSAGRFRNRLYRADIIQKVLAAGDEKEALRSAQADLAALGTVTPVTSKSAPIKPDAQLASSNTFAQALPPLVELRSSQRIESGASSIPVRFEVRSPDNAPVSGIKARVNGKLVRELKGKGLRATGVQEIEVPIPTSDSEILIFAENKNGKSDPASIKVIRATGNKRPAEFEKYDKLYLLIVGISSYPQDYKLELPRKDAQDFALHMARQSGKIYNSTVPKLLVDEQASRQNILDGLQWLLDNVGEKDAGVVFFAGHGEKLGSNYYFIPGDAGAFPARGEVKNNAEFDAWKMKNAQAAWVPGDEIAKTMHRLKGRAIFFVDTCHAGSLTKQASRASSDMTGELNTVSEEKGVIIFASSTSKELSQEDLTWGNGAFTKALIEGIQGGADKDKTGLILPSYLSAFVSKRVRELTKGEQRPENMMAGRDDPIATRTK